MPLSALPSRRPWLLPLVSLLTIAAVVLALVLGVDYDRRLASAQASVEAQRRVSALLSTLQDAQLGQRGYLLTSRDEYLEPYRTARRDLPAGFAAVRAAAGDDPGQRARLDRFEGAALALLEELSQTIALHRDGRTASALATVRSDAGRGLMETAREAAGAMLAREAELLAARNREIARRGPALAGVVLLLAFASLATLALSLRSARREAAQLRGAVDERTRELAAANDLNELVLQSATDFAIIATDPGGLIVRWNTGAERLFGWTAREMTGDTAERFFTPEDRAEGRVATEMRLSRDEGRASDERWHMRADGSRFWASGEMQPLKGADGVLLGHLKIVRDRTAERLEKERLEQDLALQFDRRQAAEGQVRQLQKMEGLGQLTAGIAHDFNNMLAVVIGAVDMARRRLPDVDAKVATLLDAASDGAQRAAALTKRLLAFSRQQPLAPSVLNINALVGGMSEILHRTLGETVRIETVLAGGLWNVHADPNELENILLNLAVNARDAMPVGGRLTIETGNAHLDDEYARANADVTAGQFVLLSVSDTGQGMPRDVLDRAFDPFFTTKGPGKGTGLGLSQLYDFARQSGGHAKIYSEEGHGTAVKLYLPRHYGADRPAAPQAPEPARDVPRGDPSTVILVVEDEERVRLVSVEALRELGYTVRHAPCGADALRMVKEQRDFTLLFTDIVMPGMTGRELADAAQAVRPDLKVLYTTGYTRNAVVHGGTIDPGVAFLPKPFTVEQLATKVAAVLAGGGVNRR